MGTINEVMRLEERLRQAEQPHHLRDPGGPAARRCWMISTPTSFLARH